MADNPLMKTVAIGLLITVVGVMMVFGPGLVGMDGFAGGFAISFAGIFVAILGIIVAALYFQQAKILSRILRGEALLAHWTFTDQMWKDYTKMEYNEEIAEKRGLFITVTGFALFFGILFWFLDNEGGFFVFLVMLGLIGLAGFTWLFSAWYYRKQNEKGDKEAFIARSGVYLNRRLYTWRSFSAKLLGVKIDNSRGLLFLKFNFSAFTLPGRQIYTVRVPIPVDQEEAAKTIVLQLNS